MTHVRSLTQDEARERAALLDVDRYDLEFDLTGWRRATPCAPPPRMTFSATTRRSHDVRRVPGRGRGGHPERQAAGDRAAGGRLELPDLRADNVLVVRSVQRRTDAGQGIHRAVDPSDGEVYVWTSFEPDDARVVFACFDQPDLKAVFGITVHVPERWTVTSNTGDAPITAAG